MMAKMGFPSIWIDLVMTCVTSVTYSFLVNGIPTDIVTPCRWLRSGDPISPYLFLLCIEGLGALIKKAITQREYSWDMPSSKRSEDFSLILR